MTNQRYVTPVMVAAAFHAALLFGVGSDDPVVTVSKPTRTKTVVHRIPLEPLPPLPPETEAAKAEQPKPLAGDPPPPDLPEPPPSMSPSDFAPPEEIRPQWASVTGTKLPRFPGFADGDINGDPRAQNFPTVAGTDQLDRMPHAKVQVAPDYPFTLKQAGVEGSVLVEFYVDTAGKVISARVVRSERREFEEPTLRAVMKWRFEPGRRDGRTVPFRMQIPVDFHLNQD